MGMDLKIIVPTQVQEADIVRNVQLVGFPINIHRILFLTKRSTKLQNINEILIYQLVIIVIDALNCIIVLLQVAKTAYRVLGLNIIIKPE